MLGDMISGGVGLAAQAYGAYESYQLGQQISGVQGQITQQQIEAEAVKRNAMELTAHRSQLEVVRNNQRARAMATNNATSQGAQFGSGLSGGLGQIQGQSGTNLLGINQNLATGEQLSSINTRIDQYQGQVTQLQGQLSTAQGIGSAGKAMSGTSGQWGFLGA